jgi:tRNA/tmRNA/rRNA uracil-C5-methylase (TrmA/RlmC/RlmD family)
MIKKNDILDLTIEDLGVNGEGIGKVDGYTLFVKDGVIGDKVTVKVMKANKNFGFARLMEIKEPSKDRVSPRCSVARQCGGCQIQCINYKEQLRFKKNKVLNNYLRGFGVNVADSILLRRGEQYDEDEIAERIGMPCFVKPAADGSSFGVMADDLVAAGYTLLSLAMLKVVFA